MKPRISLSLLLLAVVTALPASAFTDISVRIEPIQPRVGEDFVIVVEGMTEIAPVTVEEVSRGDQSVEIRLHRAACNAVCLSQPFRVDVPIDGSTDPFAEGQLVELHVNGRVGADTNRESLFWSRFAVGELFYHSMEPEIVLDPWTPSDNDRIRLLVPVQSNVCGPSVPWLERIEHDGLSISVFLRFSPGFGGGFSTADGPDPKCTPAVPFLGVTPVDLGTLAAGDYALELYFQSTFVESLPLRVRSTAFEVTDGPDSVGLQDGRFTVELEWADSDGNAGVGKPVPGPTSD
ncbi:MAG: hypothetical protein MI919_07900, partial [Holophagales bacterium]|nr:hypothetical protein [Holophagales bacterium]